MCVHDSSSHQNSRSKDYYLHKLILLEFISWKQLLDHTFDYCLSVPDFNVSKMSCIWLHILAVPEIRAQKRFFFFYFFFPFFIRYLAHLHFQCYTKSPPYPPTPTPLPTHSPPFWPWRSPVLGHIKFACPMGLSFQ